MKFLNREHVRPNMIPLNLVYDMRSFKETDILTIVYKDLDSGQKLIAEIHEPVIEIYIVKPEHRTFTHMRDYFSMDQCDKYTVKYKYRWSEAAKMLHTDKDSIRKSPYVFNIDMQVETFYLINFLNEYPTDKPRMLSLGFLDIENDVIQVDGFPSPGEAPINMVTYINAERGDVYGLVLCKDNLPIVNEAHVRYNEIKEMKDSFYEQVNAFKDNIDVFIEELHSEFDELYGNLNYHILTYESEKDLLTDLFEIIHSVDNDYIGIWNLPYDMQHIIERSKVIGMDYVDLITDKRFSHRRVNFIEDMNPLAHRRKHTCITSTIPLFVDDMVHYAGINAGGGKLPSLRLGNIAKRVLKDDKYNFGDVGDFKFAFYKEFVKTFKYNIKDTLLLLGISNVTHGMDIIYSRLTQMCVLPNEAFTTTRVVWHALIKFMYGKGLVPGINRNKGNKSVKMINYADKLKSGTMNQEDEIDDYENEEDSFYNNNLFDLYDDEDDDESSSTSKKKEKKEKFPGAIVTSPEHMSSTGTKIMGKDSKYVHDNVAVADVISEYPTANVTSNISNETLAGKVQLMDPDDIDIPIPEAFSFKGDERSKYKLDKSNLLMEAYTEKDYLTLGNVFLGLPTVSDVYDEIDEILKEKDKNNRG